MDSDDDTTTPEKNYAQPSRDAMPESLAAASIRDSVREGLRQAKARAYAQDAVNANGKRIRPPGSRSGVLPWQGEHSLSDQPVRTALLAVAGGAVLTALFIALLRGSRR